LLISNIIFSTFKPSKLTTPPDFCKLDHYELELQKDGKWVKVYDTLLRKKLVTWAKPANINVRKTDYYTQFGIEIENAPGIIVSKEPKEMVIAPKYVDPEFVEELYEAKYRVIRELAKAFEERMPKTREEARRIAEEVLKKLE